MMRALEKSQGNIPGTPKRIAKEYVERMETKQLIIEGTLEDWLAEQRIAAERVLALNDVITNHLASSSIPLKERDTENHVEIDMMPVSNQNEIQPRALSKYSPDGLDAELSEPLLSAADVEFPQAVPPQAESSKGSKGTFSSRDDEEAEEFSDLRQSSSKRRAKRNNVTVMDAAGVDDLRASNVGGMSEFMFPGMAAVQQHVMDSLNQPAHHAEEFFSETGFWASLAKNHCFTHATLAVIAFNTVWIAIDTDYNKADLLSEADWQFQFMDNFFCSFFTFEMLVRFLALKSGYFALTDPWFLFDGFLVGLMIWETWVSVALYHVGYAPTGGGTGAGSVLRIFRIFRLLRVARTARVFREVPELMILAKSMFCAMRSVLVMLSLLTFVIYIFAIVFTQLLSNENSASELRHQFQTVPTSANFLMLQVLCGFDADFAAKLGQQNLVCYGLFLLYLLLGALLLMNMLIGILCDVVFRVADDEKEATLVRDMEAKVKSLAESLDADKDGSVCREEFAEAMKKPDVLIELNEFGVDVLGLLDFANFVYQENEELSYTNFLHMVNQFRSGKMATLKDIMDMRKQMSAQVETILDSYEEANGFIMNLHYKMDKMSNSVLEPSRGSPKTIIGDAKATAELEDSLVEVSTMLQQSSLTSIRSDAISVSRSDCHKASNFQSMGHASTLAPSTSSCPDSSSTGSSEVPLTPREAGLDRAHTHPGSLTSLACSRLTPCSVTPQNVGNQSSKSSRMKLAAERFAAEFANQ